MIPAHETSGSNAHTKFITAKPLHGGFEDFRMPHEMPDDRELATPVDDQRYPLFSELRYYFQHHPPGFKPSDPTMLTLCYYPLRIVLAEWMTYVHLMSRTVKHYEYSLKNTETQLHELDISDLQRWRRRTKRSLHKLELQGEFVRLGLARESDPEPWVVMLDDITHLQDQITEYGRSLEQVVPLATSVAQLIDSRRTIDEAVNVRRLTYIALVFVPLAWVASLFSMTDDFAPGGVYFWVYFAVSIPLALAILLWSFASSRSHTYAAINKYVMTHLAAWFRSTRGEIPMFKFKRGHCRGGSFSV
jgi:hypothetical protein